MNPEESPECTDTALSRVSSTIDFKNYGGIQRKVFTDQ